MNSQAARRQPRLSRRWCWATTCSAASSDSRLLRRVREKEGLSYSVGSFLSADSFDERGELRHLRHLRAAEPRARRGGDRARSCGKALAEGFTAAEVDGRQEGPAAGAPARALQDDALAGRLASYLVLDRSFAWDAQLEARIAALTPAAVAETPAPLHRPGQALGRQGGGFHRASRRTRPPADRATSAN